jgi:lysophospholipid acyltransferase
VAPGARPTFAEGMATFVVSAFWHGFYPSYYVMFVFAAFLSEVNKDIFKS